LSLARWHAALACGTAPAMYPTDQFHVDSAQPAMNRKPWTNAMGVYEPAQRYAFELLTIWRESRKTILFVTHGIAEAVFLGTRVVVLTGPARMAPPPHRAEARGEGARPAPVCPASHSRAVPRQS